MIKIENLVKIYKSKGKRKSKALKGISLTLPNTGMVFVTGKSGSGKSTLLNMIGGLDDITSGDIIVGGNRLSKFTLKDFSNYRSTYIGFIFQDYHILDEFTVKENIELSADISNVDCDVKKCLEFVGLEGYEDRYPNELSGGQQQRVAIARALAKDSKIILADEPTGNLDAQTTKQILDLLKDMSKDRLVLIVSHNLDDAQNYADRIVSLDHGRLVADKSRIDGYNNNLVIKEKKLFIPHHKDLNSEELKYIIDEKDNYDYIIQNDDGMVETKEIELKEEKEKLAKSKLSFNKFKKIFNLIFRRRTMNKVFTIFLASVIISMFYIFQSFTAFDQTTQLIQYHEKDIKQDVVAKKIRDDVDTVEYQYRYINRIGNADVDKFYEYGYKGQIYKLYNTTVTLGKYYVHEGYTWGDFFYEPSSLYLVETLGTLNCTEEYLTKLYGVDGKLEVVGDMYAQEHGIIITDYIADALRVYKRVATYEQLLGRYPANSYYHTYINAVVITNYQDRYPFIFGEYAKLFDNDPTNDNIYESILNSEEYYDFAYEVNKFLGITYNFSPNFDRLMKDPDNNNYNVIPYPTFSTSVNTNTYNSTSIAYSEGYELKDNEIYLSTGLYNDLFNANVTYGDEFVHKNINLTFRIRGNQTYSKDFVIKGLYSHSSTYMLLSKDYYKELLEYKHFAFSLYFDGFEGIKNIVKPIEELGYYIITNDNSGIVYVERLISIFGNFMDIIAITFLFACVVYLMHFGYKSIISNYYEIGIISALGCNNKDIGKLFLLEILTVGLGILGVSLIGMYVGTFLSNMVLIETFEFVFDIAFTNIDVVIFDWNYVIIDLIIAMVIIVISALFPMFYIRKVKPVNILKAKE